jgi:hypothetical protein
MEWINKNDRKPDKIGFYLCCSNSPYSSWNHIDGNDRYEDCLIYCFYNGAFFTASNVVWWMENPTKPNNWEFIPL